MSFGMTRYDDEGRYISFDPVVVVGHRPPQGRERVMRVQWHWADDTEIVETSIGSFMMEAEEL
jgi:hypothetical protein